MEIWGLDVSSFQGTVNWNKVAAAGYRYAVLRLSLIHISEPTRP